MFSKCFAFAFAFVSVFVNDIVLLLAPFRSSSVYHGLLHTQQQPLFQWRIPVDSIALSLFTNNETAMLRIYIYNSLSLSLSVQYREQNQARLLHELHLQHMHVQISSRF